MSVNTVILIGRLGYDPEIKDAGGTNVCKFSLATYRKYQGGDGQTKEETVWHNIVAWGRQAETMAKYLKKGQEVYIQGRINNRSYDDKDGNKRYTSEVVVERFSFIGNRATEEKEGGETEKTYPDRPNKNSDDDLPF